MSDNKLAELMKNGWSYRKSSGGGSGGATTWKALGEGEPVKTALVDNVTVTLESYGNFGAVRNPFKIEFELAKEYIVNWGGEEYTVIGGTLPDMPYVYVGNPAIPGTGLADTGEPFCMLATEGGEEVQVFGKTSGEQIVSIYAMQSEIIPVPDTYLVYQFPSEIKNAEHAAAVIAEMQKYTLVSVGGTVCVYNFYEGKAGVLFKPVYEPLVRYDAGMLVSSAANYPIDTSSVYVMQKEIPTVNDMMYLASSSGKKFKLTVSDDGTLSATEVT